MKDHLFVPSACYLFWRDSSFAYISYVKINMLSILKGGRRLITLCLIVTRYHAVRYSSPCVHTECNLIVSVFITPVELLHYIKICCHGNNGKWMFMIQVA